jgi:hypothetical protein
MLVVEGQSLLPSDSAITVGSVPSMTAITELVVPRSMPTIFGMRRNLSQDQLLVLSGFQVLGTGIKSFPVARKPDTPDI